MSTQHSHTAQQTPLLSSDAQAVNRARKDVISRYLTDDDSPAVRARRWLQWFLTSKHGHYFVIVLVTLDVAGIFADFLISLHICEHYGEDMSWFKDLDDGLDTLSLVFSCLFMLELFCSIYAFGFG